MSDSYSLDETQALHKRFMEREIANAVRSFNRSTGLIVEVIDLDETVFDDDPETRLAVGRVRTLVRRPTQQRPGGVRRRIRETPQTGP